MRSLVILFLFFILIFGFGTVLVSGEFKEGKSDTGLQFRLGQVNSTNNQSSTSSDIQVDRDDDPELILPCTDEPNDCSLRSALVKANEDGQPTKITFSGHRWIRLTKPLPVLSEAKTTIQAQGDQEVHIDGNNIPGNVFRIIGANITIEGLRIYGAGSGLANLVITESAFGVIIANNIIGDGDGPSGNCGSSEFSYGGIYIDANGSLSDGARAWIYGNIIECHNGYPGDGITVLTDKVFIGQDQHGQSGESQRNTIQFNRGFGVNLNNTSGNTVCYSLLHNNLAGGINAGNLNNDLMYNKIN